MAKTPKTPKTSKTAKPKPHQIGDKIASPLNDGWTIVQPNIDVDDALARFRSALLVQGPKLADEATRKLLADTSDAALKQAWGVGYAYVTAISVTEYRAVYRQADKTYQTVTKPRS